MKKYSGVLGMPTGPQSLLSTAKATPSPHSDGSDTSGSSDDWDFDRLMIEIVKWYEDLDKQFGRAARKRFSVSCDTCKETEPGCCTQKVMVSLFEILPIASYLKAHNRDTPELREQLRLDGYGMEGTDREAWYHERHPCVFLKAGRCSIYPVRPIACRSYYVVTPSADCGSRTTQEIAHLDNREYLDRGLRRGLSIHRSLKLHESPRRILMGALPRMVLIGLELMDHDDYQGFVRSHDWPTEDNLDEWIAKGENPYREKLYQIRASKDA